MTRGKHLLLFLCSEKNIPKFVAKNSPLGNGSTAQTWWAEIDSNVDHNNKND